MLRAVVERAVEIEAEAVTNEVTREREVALVTAEVDDVVSKLVVGKRDEVEVETMVVVTRDVDDSLVEVLVEVVLVVVSSSAVVLVDEGGSEVLEDGSSSSVEEVVGVGRSLVVGGSLVELIGSLLGDSDGELCEVVSVTSTLVVCTLVGIAFPCRLACLRILNPASMAAARRCYGGRRYFCP